MSSFDIHRPGLKRLITNDYGKVSVGYQTLDDWICEDCTTLKVKVSGIVFNKPTDRSLTTVFF